MTTIREKQKECAEILRAAGIENAEAEARWIVLETAGVPATALLREPPLAPLPEQRISEITLRRAAHEPLQYLLGTAPFGELDLLVTPEVLIPRPETEVLAEYAARKTPVNGTLLDLGCGSGAIALYAAHLRSDLKITAADKSPDALAIARENAEKYGVSSRIRFVESDLFSALAGERFSTVAANLPYVTFDEYETLAPEVKDHEPQLALTAQEAGFALIRQAMEALSAHLVRGGLAVFEMSPHQTEKAENLLRHLGFEVQIFPDQYGKKRFVAGEMR